MPACHSSPRRSCCSRRTSRRRRPTPLPPSRVGIVLDARRPACRRRFSGSPSRRRPGSGHRTGVDRHRSGRLPAPSNRRRPRARCSACAWPAWRPARMASSSPFGSIQFVGGRPEPLVFLHYEAIGRAIAEQRRARAARRAMARGAARPRARTDRRARARARNRSLRPPLASTRLAGSDAADPIHRRTDCRNRRALRAHARGSEPAADGADAPGRGRCRECRRVKVCLVVTSTIRSRTSCHESRSA